MFTYIIYYIYVNVYIIYHIRTCIYPAKNELGCISKVILDTANKNIREAMALNQWRNTYTVRVFAINTCASLSYLTLKNFIFPSLKTCLKKP